MASPLKSSFSCVDLDSDLLLLALTQAVEIVGEAANHVSEEGRHKHRGLLWVEMVGIRTRLIREYFDVNSAVLMFLDTYNRSLTADVTGLLVKLHNATLVDSSLR